MPTCLITGATGFIGGRLAARLLDRGDRVVCLARRPQRLAQLGERGATLLDGDMTRPESFPPALEGVDVVYHVAGTIVARRRDDFHRVNTQGTALLAQACAACPSPPVLVFVSSLAAAGPSAPDRPRTEDDPPQPVSSYGRSKLAAEQSLRTWADRVPTSVVRPPVVYGPGDGNMRQMIDSIRRGWHLVPGRRPHLLATIYVDDLIDALLLVADRGRRMAPPSSEGATQGIYFAAGPDAVTYADLGRRLAELLERKAIVWRFRGPVVQTIATVAESVAWVRGRPSVLNRDKIREALAGSWLCDTSRIREELLFQPQFTLDAGLRESVRHFQ